MVPGLFRNHFALYNPIEVGPDCSFNELSLANNIITTHGSNLAIAIDNSNNYGKDTGVVENNPGMYLDATQFEYLQTSKSGPSSNRPTECFIGMIYFDTTLGKSIWWADSKWVDANGEVIMSN